MANSTFSPVTGYDGEGTPLEPLYLACISPISRLYLAYISPGVGKPLDLWSHRRSSTRLLHQLHAGEP